MVRGENVHECLPEKFCVHRLPTMGDKTSQLRRVVDLRHDLIAGLLSEFDVLHRYLGLLGSGQGFVGSAGDFGHKLLMWALARHMAS